MGLRCASCGYDLRGVRCDRDCPECGLAVAESLASSDEPDLRWELRGALVYCGLVAGLIAAAGAARWAVLPVSEGLVVLGLVVFALYGFARLMTSCWWSYPLVWLMFAAAVATVYAVLSSW